MQFDSLFESKAESTAESKTESKAECGAYFTVVLEVDDVVDLGRELESTEDGSSSRLSRCACASHNSIFGLVRYIYEPFLRLFMFVFGKERVQLAVTRIRTIYLASRRAL